MESNVNLADIVKASAAAKKEKETGIDIAFNQVLKEAQLSQSQLSDLWAEYSYLIDERSGRPYNYVPLNLPRRHFQTISVSKGPRKSQKERQQVKDPDNFKVEGCEHNFSRNHLYESKDFQGAIRQYYRRLGYSISLMKTHGSGWIMKIYMD